VNRKTLVTAIVMTACLMLGGAVLAQNHEVVVGEISLPSLQWGPQKASFDITNLTEYDKTISVEAVIEFEGTYMSPKRRTRTNYSLKANETKNISQSVEIPGNYGKATMAINVYDVVDVLDPLMDYQRVYSQPFSLTYHIPDELIFYFQEEITLPWMVSNSADFDTEFIRLFMILMAEGKTVDEIAAMTKGTVEYVNHIARVMARQKYVKMRSGVPFLTFPVIRTAEAQEGRELAERAADELAGLVKANIGTYRAHLADLVRQGIMPPDENDFMHGGSALYYSYPTVTALLFWFDLGQRFIAPGQLLSVYKGTDFCNARIPQYMYATQGGAYFNGSQFYHTEVGSKQHQLLFADIAPGINCVEGFENVDRLFPMVHWGWQDDNAPEPFVLDTNIVRTGLEGFQDGMEAFLSKTKADLKAISDKHGHEEFMVGTRLWFWNLVTTRATAKLVENGTLVRWGEGFYSYEELQ